MVYDSARDRTVLFGGYDGLNYQADTWEFNGASWHQIQTSGPLARWLAPLAFDSSRNVTVMFGGYGMPGYLTDTWEFDGATWSRRFTAHTPPARDWSAMTYDSRRHVVVLFGGTGGDGVVLNDTWEYNGDDWTHVTTAHAPSGRRGMTVTFDAGLGKTVMFGGESDTALNDTWEYDGIDWAQAFPAAVPSRRLWAAAAYDPALGGTAVFGGYQNGFSMNDAWVFDGDSWHQIPPPEQDLNGRFWSTATFDSARSRLLVFGGTNDLAANVSFGDTWALAGTNTLPVDWSQASTSTAPAARVWPAMDYDSARGVSVLFGGSTGGSAAFNDIWEWDGFNWVQKTTSGGPPKLAGAAMAYDSSRHVSVLFGGSDASGALSGATWEWNGTAWTQRTLAVSPPARAFASMAYDSNRGRVVLFGGTTGTGRSAETWEYDGNAWTRVNSPVSPSARIGSAIAFDAVRSRTVLFGGSDANGNRQADTWEWDGTGWSQIATTTAPYARLWAAMVFDPVRDRTVLFGGDHIQPFALGPTNDTWDWDGTSWTRDWTGAAPPVRAGQTMAFDSHRNRAVMFGGFNAAVSPNVLYGDTWELASGTVTTAGTPAVTASPSTIEFGSVQVGATSRSSNAFISSSGTGPLVFSMSTNGDFAIDSTDCPSAPSPLAAGSYCLVFVTFRPAAEGDRAGTLNLTGNMSGGSQSVSLHGTGLLQDFTISANPTVVSMTQGGQSPTSTISTTAIGAGGTVTLSAQSNDPNVSGSISPGSITAGSSATLTVTAGPSAQPGYYSLLVVGTEGGISHAVNVTLQLLAVPDFTIAANPNRLTMAQGDSQIVNIQTTMVGASGRVDLTASSAPAGPSATLASPWINAGDPTTLRIDIGYGVAPGNYIVTVTGTEGSNTHSATVSLVVTLRGIVNGGFETGTFDGWTSSGITSVVSSPHTGSYAGQVGATYASGISTMSQTFTVPSSTTKLTFWFKVTCGGVLKKDWFTVTLQDGVTGASSTVLAPVCLKTGKWTKVTVDVKSRAGHFVTVTFVNHDDGAASTPTYTLIDDLTLS
jgi:hypothetical protein